MSMHRVKFGVFLTILAMVIVGSACSPSAEPTPTPAPAPTPTPAPAPSANQAPKISGLTTPQTQTYPSNIIDEIKCNASDPDGDSLTYDWSTTGGKFTGTGPTVSWVAPENYGDYDITVTVKDGKGGITQATLALSVVSNLDPVISSLVADPATVQPNASSTITCVASDPDSDVLNYSWKASGGSITGAGSTVTWIAPGIVGQFTITVTVDDGRGGQTGDNASVTVLLSEKTETFTPLAKETGRVSSKGDKDTSRTIAGDEGDNLSYRAFWSFDLYSLSSTEVRDAKLTFTVKKVMGEPFDKMTGLGGLHIYEVRYEGQLPGFSTKEYHELAPLTIWEPPTAIDITDLVSKIGQGISASDRFQIEAKFVQQTNGDCTPDYVEWERVILTVTYAEK